MKNKRKSSLFIGSFIVLLVVLTPYLLYIHQNFPKEQSEFNTIFGTVKAGAYYGGIQHYLYFLLAKFVPFFLFLIWFLTCKHWWVHAILIPLSIYFFQFISVINDNEELVDEIDFIYAVPITLAIVIILYVIRSKLAVFISAVDLKKEMDEKMGGDF